MFTHNVDPHTWLTLHHDKVAAGAARAEAEAKVNVIHRRPLRRRRPLTELVHLRHRPDRDRGPDASRAA